MKYLFLLLSVFSCTKVQINHDIRLPKENIPTDTIHFVTGGESDLWLGTTPLPPNYEPSAGTGFDDNVNILIGYHEKQIRFSLVSQDTIMFLDKKRLRGFVSMEDF